MKELVLVFVVGGLVLFGGIYCLGEMSCANTARQMNMPYKYGLTTDCMVKTDKGWFPLANVRNEQ